MEDRITEREYELKVQLRELDEQREDLNRKKNMVFQQEDDREHQIWVMRDVLEQMKSACSMGDKNILQLIEEKQEMLNNIKNRKQEFFEELEHEIKKKKEEIDSEMEEIYLELVSLQDKQEDRKE